MSQAELGQRIGLSQPTISRIERGLDVPDEDDLPELAAALEVAVEDLERELADAHSSMAPVASDGFATLFSREFPGPSGAVEIAQAFGALESAHRDLLASMAEVGVDGVDDSAARLTHDLEALDEAFTRSSLALAPVIAYAKEPRSPETLRWEPFAVSGPEVLLETLRSLPYDWAHEQVPEVSGDLAFAVPFGQTHHLLAVVDGVGTGRAGREDALLAAIIALAVAHSVDRGVLRLEQAYQSLLRTYAVFDRSMPALLLALFEVRPGSQSYVDIMNVGLPSPYHHGRAASRADRAKPTRRLRRLDGGWISPGDPSADVMRVVLHPGDVLVFGTDGFESLRVEDGVLWDSKILRSSISRSLTNDLPLKQLVRQIHKQAERRGGGDDRLAIAIKV